MLWLAAGGLMLIASGGAAWPQDTNPQQCRRLVGGTLSCTQEPAGDAPPNTERANPTRPPSDAVVTRLIAAAATLPKQPAAKSLQLIDTIQQANFDSGSDELTPQAKAKLDA